MKNFVSNGESLQLTAPVGGVIGGALIKQGDIVGVVVADALEGDKFTLKIKGAYSGVPKAAAEAWTVGDSLYLKADGSALTKTSDANTFAGYAYSNALAADVIGDVLLAH
jgi:predicted RecA/RadA family phage recombinase